MIPVIHLFYANETNKRAFSGLILYPMLNGFTECVETTHIQSIEYALMQANYGLFNRSHIDNRAPILAHKVNHSRIEEIRRKIKG